MRAAIASALFFIAPFGCSRAEPTAAASSPVVIASARQSNVTAPLTSVTEPVTTVATLPAPSPPSPAPPAKPRVYAKTRFVWIRPEPDTSKQWIGYLWTGESVELASDRPAYGPGCETWYAVVPLGYVCVDGLRATLDPTDPGYVAVQRYAAELSSAWPHQYGEAKRLKRLLDLDGSPLSFPNLPNSVHDSRTELRSGSTVAFVSDLRVGERDYLLGADLSYVPKELVTPLPRSEFRGVELGSTEQLPLAFFRHEGKQKYTKGVEGFAPSGEAFARLSHVALTGKSETVLKTKYLEARDGTWLREMDAVVPKLKETPPWGTATPKGRGTWIEVSVTEGWLVAYENTTPVFTTLISPGRGGPAEPDEDPLKRSRTPLGVFPISGKFATATMEAPGNLIHTAVPWTQNFSGPYAIHTAYWHDDWGTYKSGGCINVSPLDGKRLFEWTEPPVPAGWHGVRWLPWRGPATILIVRR